MSKWTPEGEPEPCHRCKTLEGVKERFIVTNTRPVIAGSTLKLLGYTTWGCDSCWEEFRQERHQEEHQDD